MACWTPNLSFEIKAGQAWERIRVCLGDHPLNHRISKHGKPSQERRRKQRAEACAAEEAANALNLSTSGVAE